MNNCIKEKVFGQWTEEAGVSSDIGYSHKLQKTLQQDGFGRVGLFFALFRARNNFLADVTVWITFFKKKEKKEKICTKAWREGDKETSPFKDTDGNPSCIL